MAFDLNYTTTYNTSDDSNFRMIEMSGTKSVRKAILADGTEIERTISHDVKKRERHVVKDVITIPATAVLPVRTVSVHTVIDQALAPHSADAEAIKLATMHDAWVTANAAAIMAGEI